jgi:hypothetical protein
MRLLSGIVVFFVISGFALAQAPAPAPATTPAPAQAAAKPAATPPADAKPAVAAPAATLAPAPATTPAPAPAAAKPAATPPADAKPAVAAPAATPAPAPPPAAAAAAPALTGWRLTDVKRVYIFPMKNSLDQFLASRLTSMKVFEVVADPQLADALITDNVGQAFQERLKEVFPPPTVEKEKDQDEKDSEKDAKPVDTGAKPPISTFSRGRGSNAFVFSQKSMTVLWAAYVPPKNSSEVEVDQVARKLSQALLDEISSKKKSKASSWLNK